MNNEPVAYWDGKEPNVLGLAYHQNDYCFIPLYTRPVKELTDEEIEEVIGRHWNKEYGNRNMLTLCRAILRKEQENG